MSRRSVSHWRSCSAARWLRGRWWCAWTKLSDDQDLTRALALVALAGTGLILVLRVRGRRVVGLLLASSGWPWPWPQRCWPAHRSPGGSAMRSAVPW